MSADENIPHVTRMRATGEIPFTIETQNGRRKRLISRCELRP